MRRSVEEIWVVYVVCEEHRNESSISNRSYTHSQRVCNVRIYAKASALV